VRTHPYSKGEVAIYPEGIEEHLVSAISHFDRKLFERGYRMVGISG